MANTTNLNLVKPDYTDDADIEDINGNSDKIDAFAGDVLANIGGTDFSTSSTYDVGAVVKYEGKLYRCVDAVSTAGSWVSANWEQISIQSEIKESLVINVGSVTLTDLQTYLETLGSSMLNNSYRYIRFYNLSGAAPFEQNVAYFGQIFKFTTGRYEVAIQNAGNTSNNIVGIYNSVWTWESLGNYAHGLLTATVPQTVSNVNLNDYKTGGTYYFATGCTNVPSTYFLCTIINHGSDFAIQIGVRAALPAGLYFRTWAQNTWTDWQLLNAVTYDSTFTTMKKQGRICTGSFTIQATSSTTGTVGTLGSAYRPTDWVRAMCRTDNADKWGKVDINPTTGEVTYKVPSTGVYYCMVSYVSGT